MGVDRDAVAMSNAVPKVIDELENRSVVKVPLCGEGIPQLQEGACKPYAIKLIRQIQHTSLEEKPEIERVFGAILPPDQTDGDEVTWQRWGREDRRSRVASNGNRSSVGVVARG